MCSVRSVGTQRGAAGADLAQTPRNFAQPVLDSLSIVGFYLILKYVCFSMRAGNKMEGGMQTGAAARLELHVVSEPSDRLIVRHPKPVAETPRRVQKGFGNPFSGAVLLAPPAWGFRVCP